RRIVVLMLLLTGLSGLTLAACGASSEAPSPAPDYSKELAGSPPPLAALHSQGDELITGGKDAFEKRLAELKGFPVVVNAWASWCAPCRAEFPHFQNLAARYGKQVAFLGVNSED